MREYMRRRRAAARERQEPLSREFLATSPTIQAASTFDEIGRAELDFKYEELNTGKSCELFVESLKRFHYGDMRGVENGLLCHARTLDRLFNAFVRRGCREGSPEYRELEFLIAFRAQSHYRATLATLASIKNPARVAFVRQANVAHGPQQANNAPQPAETSRARESENRPNKLLEQQRNEWMDARTAAATRSSDPSVEAVGAVNRTKDGRG